MWWVSYRICTNATAVFIFTMSLNYFLMSIHWQLYIPEQGDVDSEFDITYWISWRVKFTKLRQIYIKKSTNVILEMPAKLTYTVVGYLYNLYEKTFSCKKFINIIICWTLFETFFLFFIGSYTYVQFHLAKLGVLKKCLLNFFSHHVSL